MVLQNQKIIPHLWFDKEAKDAAAFYAAIFPDSKIIDETIIQDTPSGDATVVSFQLWGQRFMAINGGPHFTFNPSISFFINIDPSRIENAEETVQMFWDYLSQDGQVLMALDRYPFSKKYGWIQDKYGVSWQIILSNPDGDVRPPIVPSFMFIGENSGKAEEAIQFYTSIFRDSRLGHLAKRPKGMEPEKEGTIMFADFMLENEWFAAMESAYPHGFTFNEAISFMVYCKNQQELDYYWESLTAVPESEQCGWLKDKYGLSWQIVPEELHEILLQGSPEEAHHLNQEILKMKKIDMETLRKVRKKY